jgi:hypothetical protein
MDFAWGEDIEKGVKKAAGRHADATNAPNIVGQAMKRRELIGLLVDKLMRGIPLCPLLAVGSSFRSLLYLHSGTNALKHYRTVIIL